MNLHVPRRLLLADPIASGIELRVLRFNSHQHTDGNFHQCGVVFPSELVKAGRTRRCEYLAGRRCARSALESLGCGNVSVPIGPDGAPGWPPGYSGSISHNKSWAAAAVAVAAHTRPGIDCETIVDGTTFRDIANIVAANDELKAAERELGDRHLALTLLFSAKESVFKTLESKDRAGHEFSSLRITISDCDSGIFLASEVRPTSAPRAWRGLYRHLDPRTILTFVVSANAVRNGKD